MIDERNPRLQETEGDTFSRPINVSFDNGDPVDITGWEFYVTVKDDPDDSDADAVLSTDITSHDSATDGETSFTFTSTEMEGISGPYFFEIKYKDDTGEVETVVSKPLDITKAVRDSV